MVRGSLAAPNRGYQPQLLIATEHQCRRVVTAGGDSSYTGGSFSANVWPFPPAAEEVPDDEQ